MIGPEDTADVLKYSGVELTEEKRMDKTVDMRENLRRVKELQEEQRKKKDKEQKEEEEQVRVLTEQNVEEEAAREEVKQRRQPRLEMLKRGRSLTAERRKGVHQAKEVSLR